MITVIDLVCQHGASFSAVFLKQKACLLGKVFFLSCEFFHCGCHSCVYQMPLTSRSSGVQISGLRCHSAPIGVITALPFLVFGVGSVARTSTKSPGI